MPTGEDSLIMYQKSGMDDRNWGHLKEFYSSTDAKTAGIPRVSVIINTFNYGHFIEEAINSVLTQTLHPNNIEIIVVDDGSTDDTSTKVEKYGEKIRYIQKENKGQASALNVGFENANGEIIAFLDSDDYWAPEKLMTAVQAFRKHEALDIFCHNLDIIDDSRGFIKTYLPILKDDNGPKKVDLKKCLRGRIPIFPPTSGMTFTARCLKNIMPIPEHYRICADAYLRLFSLFYAREILYSKESLGYYRIHGDNFFENRDKTIKRFKEIETRTILIQDLEAFGQKLGLDVSPLINELASWLTLWKEGKIVRSRDRNTFSLRYGILTTIKLTFKVHCRILRDEGVKMYFLYAYHYRKGQFLKWLKRRH